MTDGVSSCEYVKRGKSGEAAVYVTILSGLLKVMPHPLILELKCL